MPLISVPLVAHEAARELLVAAQYCRIALNRTHVSKAQKDEAIRRLDAAITAAEAAGIRKQP